MKKLLVLLTSLLVAAILMSGGYGFWQEKLYISGTIIVKEKEDKEKEKEEVPEEKENEDSNKVDEDEQKNTTELEKEEELPNNNVEQTLSGENKSIDETNPATVTLREEEQNTTESTIETK